MLKGTEQVKVGLLAVFSSLLLSACGGGGGGSGSDDGPTASKLTPGVFDIGRVLSGGTNEGDSLLSPTGKFVATFATEDQSSYTFGNLEFSGSGKISGQVTEYIWNSSSWGVTGGSLSGQVISSRRADLTASKVSPISDSVLFRKQGSSDSGVTLTQISAIFSMTGSGNTSTITIQEDGVLDGVDQAGCVFSGEVDIPNTTINVFEVTYKAENCSDPDQNGNFSGLGTYNHASDPSDGELIFYSHNENIAWMFKGKRA